VEPSMSVNKNVSVCVATSPRLLIRVAANRCGQKATGLLNRAAQTAYVRRQRPTRYRNAAQRVAAGGGC
jgi:hypothetical protein